MKPPLHVVTRGAGPDVVLVHGSASDADGWTTVFAHLASELTLWAYDRRGTDRSPLPPGRMTYGVDDHARDLIALFEARIGRPAVVVGSSFGAVVALHAARLEPAWFRGLVLCEPPLPPTDRDPPVPDDFMDELLRQRDEVSGEAAGRFFLRRVLGDDAFARMRPSWVERCAALWPQIILDCQALQDHPPRYAELAKIQTPALLVGGARSAAYFPPALAALERGLPNARRVEVAGAGHMIHSDRPAEFNTALRGFVAERVRPDAPTTAGDLGGGEP